MILFDFLAYFLALMLAYVSRFFLDNILDTSVQFNFTFSYFLGLWWIPMVVFVVFVYEGMYSKRFLFWDEIAKISRSVTLGILAVFVIVSLAKISDQISRLTIIFLWFYMLLLIPLLRYLAKIILDYFGLWQKRVAILGSGNIVDEIIVAINSEKNLGWNVVNTINDDVFFSRTNQKSDDNFDIVIISSPQLSPKRLLKLSKVVQKHSKVVYALPDIQGIALPNADLYRLYSNQLLLLKLNNNLKSFLNISVKWLIDKLLAVLLLPILLFTICFLAILIKIDSTGPIFYLHTRVGKNGQEINVFKFRTMYLDAKQKLEDILKSSTEARVEWEQSHKLKSDPRITRIGCFLRKYSLDELPQIFNILLGNMSFVGPRPVLQSELDKFYREDSEYYTLVRPGITGLWQVSGRNHTTYERRVELDAWYVQNWSVWLDIVILLKTFVVVANKEGAY